MSTLEIVSLSAFICLVFWFVLIIIIVKLNKRKKAKLEAKQRELEQKLQPENPSDTVVQRKIDKRLEKDVTYIIGSKGGIVAGKYIILSADESNTSFDIKLGNYYKLYDNGNTIVLKNGEEITPVTCPILLR